MFKEVKKLEMKLSQARELLAAESNARKKAESDRLVKLFKLLQLLIIVMQRFPGTEVGDGEGANRD